MADMKYYSKKSCQGENIYQTGSKIESIRYNPYRINNRKVVEQAYKDKKAVFKHLIVEPTNRCNLACPFCSRKKLTRPIGDMDWDTYTKIIDEASTQLIHSLSLYMLGESLMHPKIIDMIKYAKNKGIPYVDISSNFSETCQPYIYEKLARSGVDEIIVSLDGVNQKTLSENRPGAIYLNIVNHISTIKLFRYLDKPIIRLQIIDMPSTAAYIDKFIDSWVGKVDVVYRKTFETMNHVFKRKKLEDCISTAPCKLIYHTLSVQQDGIICGCCHIVDGSLSLGNARDTTLMEAWEKLGTLRKNQEQGLWEAPCNECLEKEIW